MSNETPKPFSILNELFPEFTEFMSIDALREMHGKSIDSWDNSGFRESIVKASANMSAILRDLNWERIHDMNMGFAEDLLASLRMFSKSSSISIFRRRLNQYGGLPDFFRALATLLDRSLPLESRMEAINSIPGISMSLASHFLFLFDPHRHPLLSGEILGPVKMFSGWDEVTFSTASGQLGRALPNIHRQTLSHLCHEWLCQGIAKAAGIEHMGLLAFMFQTLELPKGKLYRPDFPMTRPPEHSHGATVCEKGTGPKVRPEMAVRSDKLSTSEASDASDASITEAIPVMSAASYTADRFEGRKSRSLKRHVLWPHGELPGFLAGLTEQGYIFPHEAVQNLHLSIVAKPFVILSGVSGTGKTKLAQLYARYMTQEYDRDGYVVIPVKPEFRRSADLLGSLSPQGDSYSRSPALKVILNALTDPSRPYFIILDEMNIAPAEIYFADFLSAMESNEPIHLHHSSRCLPSTESALQEDTEPFVCNRDCRRCFFATGEKPDNLSQAMEKVVPPMVSLPANLVIMGTVNVDETVKPFPPKLIDRANTIDFYHVDILGFEKINHGGHFSSQARVLDEIHHLLRPYSLHFGYRTEAEIFAYLTAAQECGIDPEGCLDIQIAQKILPKFHGRADRLKRPLEELFCYASARCSAHEDDLREVISPQDGTTFVPLPKTAFKTAVMLLSLMHTGRAGYMG
ncbi:MAG: hypothetical protein CVV64_10955 [Candidatus Wallbacteria bacterium HGW-Wallbacteria-1]|jgi:energy-coupling factor transporter ATP-binding protein EcfA2|uniref:ATPase dynein-related AAA domain-containing protein n=1 Tax=Candidatus Wallbacteria bacterium HGW-Wallbacteria-1 TaxID=2013854 RepID=A0A2N1PPG7_9BACT|nr:MAG: hypothetical protein CVV64_10955 [Candidatus Wallbacteria bacterium HGW-Wallbacteria-1]